MATIQEDSDLGRNGNGAVHTAESIKRSFLDSLFYRQAQFPKLATSHDYYKALAYTVRDIMAQKWLSSARTYTLAGSRTVCYLSAEFLLGPHLGNNLINLGLYDVAKEAIKDLLETVAAHFALGQLWRFSEAGGYANRNLVLAS